MTDDVVTEFDCYLPERQRQRSKMLVARQIAAKRRVQKQLTKIFGPETLRARPLPAFESEAVSACSDGWEALYSGYNL